MPNTGPGARRNYHSILARMALGMALVPLAAAAAAAECASLWSVNGSTVCLTADGDQRQLRYEEPRAGMREEGVERGTLLFEGRLDGTALTGTAYVFSGRCNRAFPYPVSGRMEPDSRTIILSGEPVARLSRDCRVLTRRPDVQRIALIEAAEPPLRPVAGPAPDADAVLHQRRFSAFLAELQSCQRGDVTACDAASRSALVSPEDRLRIAEMREAAETAVAEKARLEREAAREREAERRRQLAAEAELAAMRARLALEAGMRRCISGERASCATALASPALAAADRKRIEMRLAELDAPGQALPTARRHSAEPAPIREASAVFSLPALPDPVTLPAALAVLLAAAGLWIGRRKWHGSAEPATSRPASVRSRAEESRRESPHAAGAAAPVSRATPPSSRVEAPIPAPAPAVQERPARPASPATPRDTPAALEAMRIAFAYLEEVRAAPSPGLEDTDARKELLNSLSLASKRLVVATEHDPDAILESADKDGNSVGFTINELKARVLLQEGLTHQLYDVRRALPALTAATRHDPDNALAFYALGLVHAENHNKTAAIEALKRAVALDPGNIDFRKELDRVENLSAATVAAYKATRAAERVTDAGVAVANAGIRVYNFGVIIWNIFAFTWNVLTFPLRLVHRIFRVFDRVLGRA